MRGTAMAVFASAPYLGPAMGPIVGGFLGEAAGFRWVFGLVAILTAILTIVGILATPGEFMEFSIVVVMLMHLDRDICARASSRAC
jgi:MFS family permease